VASQPALTIGDATVSLLLGILLFREEVRLGVWLLPELVGAGLVVWGVLRLIRVVPHAAQTLTGSATAEQPSGRRAPEDPSGSRAA
jgi:hypothetical protein